MQPIRIIIVDDSAFMRKMLKDILSSDGRFEVVATAKNGQDGLKKIVEHRPDVVTLDVEMPIMDGITALKKIMETAPLPVVMLSSLTGEGTAKTVEALSLGAVDFIAKPSGAISLDINDLRDEINNKVYYAATSKIAGLPLPATNRSIAQMPRKERRKTIVGIGASTGGPRALQHFLSSLPRDFPAAVLIVQHMPAGFTRSLAERLDSLSAIHIKEAEHGEILRQGTAYIAPGNKHMKAIKSGNALTLELSDEDQRNGHRPSVDILFESISQLENMKKVAIVLTGMGSDGSKGIKLLKEKDADTFVIAEAEDSAVVYGMPKAAVNTNCVNHIAPVQRISEFITRMVSS